MHTISFPIRRYQGFLLVTWRRTWCKIWIYKGVVLAHFIPHMILSQINWDYNKNWQVDLGVYLQSSQVNDPKNNNRPRTNDGIYSCPASNLQGGHHIMNMQIVQFIIIPQVVGIPYTNVVINSVKRWQRINYLSHENFIFVKRN